MRKLLELQADRIEMVLAHHKAPARVAGGVVTPRWVQFHLAPALGTRLNRVQALADELALALGAPQVRVSRHGAALHLEVPRTHPEPVRLLDVCRRLPAVPLGTAVLGIADDGAPLLLRLPSPDVAHVLVAGTTGSGKTALAQAIVLSLALAHRRSQLQLVLIDPKAGRAFGMLAGLPHLLKPVIVDVEEAAAALVELTGVMEQRDRQRVSTPRIVVVIDELADLVATAGKPALEALARLAQRGREAGIHVVACTQKPSAALLGAVTKANFPVRLVGRVTSIEDARVATGIGGSGAERLCGRGDFLAVSGAGVIRFQAAFAAPEEIGLVVDRLSSGQRGWDVADQEPDETASIERLVPLKLRAPLDVFRQRVHAD
ncbi:MAG TPA: DNA translocase FtsK [Anaerolineae bacterium]|nr:DNA translocase FtsK [Anaerolineae bacterium]